MNRSLPPEKDDSLELTDPSDLMEKQSVRATFRLSVEFIEALSILSAQLGIKQKSLFDHLMEDAEKLRAIAGKAQPDQLEKKGRIQKTFVMSRKSLSALDAVSKDYAASRDDLVEYSILRLLPILRKELSKQNQRERALNRISGHFQQSAALLEEVSDLVGPDDPIYRSLHSVFSAYEDALENIERFVKSGKRISDLSMEKFQR